MSPAKAPNCLNVCQHEEHGDLVSSAIVRGTDDEAIAFMKNLCCQSSKTTDSVGRTALHVAASCGKIKVILWLLSQGANINQRDLESGYTPLHRAILYGNIHAAVLLHERGANLNVPDEDGLTPVDLIAREQPRKKLTLQHSNYLQLYMWGANTNYNLGQSNLSYRDIPEYVELIHRGGDFIRSLSLNKFHTIFLSSNGRAFACGFGIGGRLGLGKETSVIIPQQIDGLKGSVKMVAAGVNHSLFLTESSQVFSCGINDYHQLGLTPPPEKVLKPALLTLPKTPKSVVIEGVGAAKYHSVLWSESVMFTFGLNAGQLGHIKNPNEKTIVNPRMVSSLKVSEGARIRFVGVSDGAIVVYTSDGSIQALHQYQVRTIASKLSDIVKIDCIGGTLDTVGDGKLTEKGGLALRIAALDKRGYLYIWTEETHRLSQCLMVPRKRVFITDFCINHYGFGLITGDYEAFTGVLLAPEKHTRIFKSHFKSSHVSLFQTMKLKRLPALHRAVNITCDPKGNNFAALQYKPRLYMKTKPFTEPSTFNQDFHDLLLKSSELDPVSDVIVTAGSRTFAAHSFLLSQGSSYLAKALYSGGQLDSNQKVHERDSGKKFEVNFAIDANICKEILDYLYSGSCLLTKLGPCHVRLSRQPDIIPLKDETKLSACDYENQRNKGVPKGGKAKGRKKSDPSAKISPDSRNNPCDPLSALGKVAKDWQMDYLVKRLANLQLSDGYIIQRSYRKPFKANKEQRHFSRNSFSDLWDVTFLCQDGVTICAHKCVLVARSVYFEAMLMSGWIETSHSDGINMPVPSKVFKVVLNFLYEDEATELRDTKDIDFLCDVLAVAHQLLIVRLQQICENCLAQLITFKNASELISFADCFDASGLRSAILEFICLNLPTFFELGSLSSLGSKTLDELSDFYKFVAFDVPLKIGLKETIETPSTQVECKLKGGENESDTPDSSESPLVPYVSQSLGMASRSIAPMTLLPSFDDLKKALEGEPSIATESEADWIPRTPKSDSKQTPKTPSTARKRRPSRNSEGGRSRKSSTSSQVSYTSTSEADTTREFDDEPFSFDDLEERVSPRAADEWIVVGKSPRESKSRTKEPQMDGGAEDKADVSQACNSPKEVTVIRNSPNKISVVSPAVKTDELSLAGDVQEPPHKESAFFPSLAEAATTIAYPAKKSGRMPKFQAKPKKPPGDGKAKDAASPALSWRTPNEGSNNWTSLTDIMKREAASGESCSPQHPREQKGPSSPAKADESAPQATPERKGWNIPAGGFSPGDPQNGIAAPMGTPLSPAETPPGLSLSNIMKEEIKNTQKLKRQTSKPLAMIQLEDRAMEELLAFYGGPFNPEEMISVARASEDYYKPQWK